MQTTHRKNTVLLLNIHFKYTFIQNALVPCYLIERKRIIFQAAPQRQTKALAQAQAQALAQAPRPPRAVAARIVPTETHPAETQPAETQPAETHPFRDETGTAPSVQSARPNVATPEPAAPDLPAALGWTIIGSFGAVMLAFMIFFGGSLQARFMTVISLVYLIVYLTVPVIFFRLQAKTPRRTKLRTFLRDGVSTWTGHLTASEAAFQILTIPVTLAFGVVGLGLVALLAQ